MAAGDILALNGNLSPNRTASKFIGTGDQAFVVDAFAVARVAAGDTTGTISAWVNIPNDTGDYAIVSCGDTAAIEFLTLRVTAGKLVVELNDATTDQFEVTSTAQVVPAHTWTHIAVTQDATRPTLYVNGKAVAMTDTLATLLTPWFGALALTDDGSIGAGEEAGGAAQIRECVGAISDVKYWTVALTAAQVERDYRGQAPASITGTAADLTDWWKMGSLVNEVTAANNGVKGASILYVRAYSEFTSMVAHSGVVVADDIAITTTDEMGQCIIVKAA